MKKSTSLSRETIAIFCLLPLLWAGCSQPSSDIGNFSENPPAVSETLFYPDELQTEFSDWEEAYRYILNHHRDYIADPFGYQREEWEKKDVYHMYEDAINIATHDYDGDGTPELILSAECATVAIYSYCEGKIVKRAELPLDEKYSCIGIDTYLDENTVTLIQEYDRYECRYVIWGYVEGACRTGIYEEHPPLKSTVDGQAVSAEELLQIFPSLQKSIVWDWYVEDRIERFCIDPRTHGLRTQEIMEQYSSYILNIGKGALPIDENFDLSRFAR